MCSSHTSDPGQHYCGHGKSIISRLLPFFVYLIRRFSDRSLTTSSLCLVSGRRVHLDVLPVRNAPLEWLFLCRSSTKLLTFVHCFIRQIKIDDPYRNTFVRRVSKLLLTVIKVALRILSLRYFKNIIDATIKKWFRITELCR